MTVSVTEPFEQQPVALLCGIPPNDGLMVAYLPKLDAVLQEVDTTFGTVLVMDGTAIDIRPAGKWWLTRKAVYEAAQAYNSPIDRMVEPVWSGPAQDFKIQLVLDKRLPKPEGYALNMRAYSKGPWINIEPNPEWDLAMGMSASEIEAKYSKKGN